MTQVGLRSQDFVGAAVEETGLDDFGPDGWRDALDILIRSAEAEACLSDVGHAVFSSWVRDRLVNRLRLVDWAWAHPEECGRAIEGPLLVTGLGRSGTTFLHELLAADPSNRSLMKWEAEDPIPPPETATLRTDPRIARCVEATELLFAGMPALKAAHYEPGDGPIECRMLLGQAFRSMDFPGLFTLPSYVGWWLEDDQRPAYAMHRLGLSVLQSRAPGRWTLKDPWHMLGLDVLLDTYPDARVVVLHRDPVNVVASMAGLSAATMPDLMRTEPVPPAYWGSHALRTLRCAHERAASARTRLPEGVFLDVSYDGLVADPVATVADIYAFAAREFTDAAEAAVSAYVANRPQHRYGVHRYSLEEFGLTAEQVRESFA